MSLEPVYRPIDGTVALPVDAPNSWADSVSAFYNDPNNDRWPGDLGRILYHESVHHWQMLSSGYVANLVLREWLTLLRFEAEGSTSADAGVESVARVRNDQPFSPKELIECWARYWDVHTRGPTRLLAEERLEPVQLPQRPSTGAAQSPYADVEFDRFMQNGPDAALYARPYRWALNEVGGDSRFLNLVFPVLVFHAFGSRKPVDVFIRSLVRARESQELEATVNGAHWLINLGWLQVYPEIISQAVQPVLRELGEPDFTAGWDVLERGVPLRSHPVWALYRRELPRLTRNALWAEYVVRYSLLTDQASIADLPVAEITTIMAVAAANSDPWLMFMLPGQPEYRHILGTVLPPPRIRFRDGDWCFGGYPEGPFAGAYREVDERVRRFRNAQYAARRGIPLHEFEKAT